MVVGELLAQPAVLARIVHVDPAAEHGDRAAGTVAAPPRARRRRSRARIPTTTATPGRRELARQPRTPRRGRSARRRASPRSRRPEAAAASSPAERKEKEGRVGDLPEGLWIFGVERRDELHAACARPRTPMLRPPVSSGARSTARARSREPSHSDELLLLGGREGLRRRRAPAGPARASAASARGPGPRTARRGAPGRAGSRLSAILHEGDRHSPIGNRQANL